VLGSSALLPQLVTNLVLNAIVHNLPSGGAVAVRTHSLPQAVALVVENTGEVLPSHLVATLIEPFQRGAERTRGTERTRGDERTRGTERTRGDDHAGAGLGLAIVDRITQAHGGTLVLTPRPDGGLIVTVWLPHPYPAALPA
jgi:two-component system sensor histidine kinase VanS